MKIVEIGKTNPGISKQMNQLPAAVIPSQQLPTTTTTSDSDEWLLATHGRTFHFAARFLPPKHRRQTVILYAFFRTLDDLVDIPVEGLQLEDIHLELRAWQYWFKASRSIPAPREPLGARLSAIMTEHSIPTAIFLDFLDGLFSDLEQREIRNFSEMYRYCYRVAGTVGLAMTYVLGVKSAQALVAAENLGISMQLTNILRDVGGDLAAGRIYLPQDELAHFGSSRDHLTQLFNDQRGPDERFRALMCYQVARAHHYYIHGMSGIWLLPHECRLPMLVASRLYRRILTVIEHKNYDVLRSRATTNFPEKVREAAIAYILDHLWRHGEMNPGTQVGVPIEI